MRIISHKGAVKLKNQDISQIIRVVKQYYELNLSQEQIAKSEHISKATVSRMIHKASELNFVKIEISYPLESVEEIEENIKRLFPIENVFICPAYIEDYLVRIKDTCKAVAQDISKMVQDNDTIGVSWGRTMDSVSSMLEAPNPPKRNITVVQLHGTVAKNIASSKFNSIIENFSDKFLGTGYLLPAPVIVDTKEIANAIMSDSNIQAVMDIARKSEYAVFGIGEISSRSVLVERGIYTEEQYNMVEDIEVVGDICSRYFDVHGKPVLHELHERTIAITMDELLKKKCRIGVAVGEHKTKAIIGALNSGIMTSFYTDEITAREVLLQYDRMKLRQRVI